MLFKLRFNEFFSPSDEITHANGRAEKFGMFYIHFWGFKL